MTDRASAPGRASGAPKMMDVFRVLVAACEEDFECEADDSEPVWDGADGSSRLTFGMIRAAKAALSSPSVAESPATTALELLRHIQRGHSAVNREHYIECSCGMTFWVPMPKPLVGPLPVRSRPAGDAMTPANLKRLNILSRCINDAVKMNAPSAVVLLQIFSWQEDLLNIASDLHMRPEANDAASRDSQKDAR